MALHTYCTEDLLHLCTISSVLPFLPYRPVLMLCIYPALLCMWSVCSPIYFPHVNLSERRFSILPRFLSSFCFFNLLICPPFLPLLCSPFSSAPIYLVCFSLILQVNLGFFRFTAFVLLLGLGLQAFTDTPVFLLLYSALGLPSLKTSLRRLFCFTQLVRVAGP